jgi:N-acetyl-anhydromuramyl-L-alanine amidase AmpD
MQIIPKLIKCNYTKGRGGFKPRAVILHIMAGTLKGTDSWFANPVAQASAHYGIGLNGEIHQYVNENDMAWHAGVVIRPTWKLLNPKVNVNKETIGIEHEGQPITVWSREMKESSASLVADICKRWGIPLDRDHIIGHYQISAGRRDNCPSLGRNKNQIIEEIINLAKLK